MKSGYYNIGEGRSDIMANTNITMRIDEELKLTNEQIENAVYNSDKMVEIFGSSRYSYLLNYV